MRECVIHDAMDQRIAKTVTNKNVTTGDKFVTTYYVRDPQGNVLAVYEHKHGESGNGTFTLTEQHLYGAGRLGMRKRDLALNVANASESTPPVTHYELTNHLGNVMAVISDKASATNEPTVVSLSDYYPFGMTEPGRSYTRPGDDYRFGYTGHEKENDLAEGVYTTEYRLLDTRLGKWLSVDPLFAKYPGMSSYNYCAGNPMVMVDPDGMDKVYINLGGQEVYRVITSEVNETYIEMHEKSPHPSKSTAGWMSVPMPKLIGEVPKINMKTGDVEMEKVSDAIFQENDYFIAARTAYFNRAKNNGLLVLYTDGGAEIPREEVQKIPDLDPTLVKAIALRESRAGKSKIAIKEKDTDIMSANHSKDWAEYKAKYGMKRGDMPSASNSVFYGIRILAAKGFKGGIDYDKKTGVRTFDFKGWENAVLNYNGKKENNHMVKYQKEVLSMWHTAEYACEKVTNNRTENEK